MNIILKAADDGRFLDTTELWQALPYQCDYGSLRTSLRFLLSGGMIERERVGRKIVSKPTAAAYFQFRSPG